MHSISEGMTSSSLPSWGFDVPLAKALCKTFLLRMLNDSWAGRNPTKGCSADWRRRMTWSEGLGDEGNVKDLYDSGRNWTGLLHDPVICMEGRRRNMRTQGSLSPGLDLNPGRPKYELGKLENWPPCYVKLKRINYQIIVTQNTCFL
jgi:hypothetical protein